MLSNKFVVLGILILVIAGLLSLYMSLNVPNPTKNDTIVPLAKHTVVKITIDRKEVVTQDKYAVRHVSLPKFGNVELRITDRGEVVIASTSILPRLGILPHLGIAWTGKFEPTFGLQVLRIEPIGLGGSFNVTPSLIGVSIDTDLTQNSLVGLGSGVSFEDMKQRYFLFFSLTF